jgi:ubiquinone biosynthesis protein UbiJ
MQSPFAPFGSNLPDPAAVLTQLAQMAEPLVKAMPQPPSWLKQELDQRLVLWLNHVIGAEPEAVARLRRHQGKVVWLQVQPWSARWKITPAGLLDIAEEDAKLDLTLAVIDSTVASLTRDALAGKRPDVRIEGDVQLAAEIGWLMEHLRWDVEEDLSRIIGDAPAHTLMNGVRGIMAALGDLQQRFAGKAA